MRLNAKTLGIFALILAFSILFGFAFDGVCSLVDRLFYPLCDYDEEIREQAEVHALPVWNLYGIAKTLSDFEIDKVDGEAIGIFQLDRAKVEKAETILGETLSDMNALYSPSVNITYGSAYIEYLYRKYERWDDVYLVLILGEEEADQLLLQSDTEDFEYEDDVQDKLEKFQKNVKKYTEIYG